MAVTPKKEWIDKIYREIFDLSSSKIEEVEKKSICEFIDTTVNGDNINSYLVINIGSNVISKICTYILTDIRLIQIQIEKTLEISSLTYLLNDIIGIERKLTAPGRATIQIMFKNGLVGLKYPENSYKTTEFFQEVEKSWANKV